MRAGAFDTVLKSWIETKLDVLRHATRGAPIADMGGMLQLVVTVVDLGAVLPAGGGGGSGSGAAAAAVAAAAARAAPMTSSRRSMGRGCHR